jgi:tRNA (guanosine-2'-O-)-methyltransferase
MILDKEHYLKYLSEMITPERLQRMMQVLRFRTRHLTVVLEDIYQPHNASAVLRSCDCFGLMDVHIIENRNTYQVNPDVALGASKWLSMHRYNTDHDNTSACFEKLKQDGYRIVATGPHKNDCLLHELDIETKTALVFGNELDGLSEIALHQADAYVKIPMVGFTESLNISVSAAVCMSSLASRLRDSSVDWALKETEHIDILIQWIKNTLKYPDQVQKEYILRQSLSGEGK